MDLFCQLLVGLKTANRRDIPSRAEDRLSSNHSTINKDTPRSYSFENAPTSSTSVSLACHVSAIRVMEAELSRLLRGEESAASEGRGRRRNSGVWIAF